MFTFIRNYSIRRKLMTIMLITAGVVLLMVSLAFFVNSALSFRSMMLNDQRILANIIGSNTAAAVTFNDQKAASETIEGLSANPHVIAAAVINSSNRLFALYVRSGIDPDAYGLKTLTSGALKPIVATDLLSLESQQDNLWARNASIKTVVPFLTDNQQLSTIVIVSDIGELNSQLLSTLALLGAVFIGALLLAYIISSKLQAVITEPVLHLAATMNQVSREKNYTIRADFAVGDEIGDLVTGFNQMLEQIELQDEQLKQYHLELEDQVTVRTYELTTAKLQLENSVVELKQATKAAESASLAKSQFLANMSHEIRTPMHGVLGMTELLLESSLSENQQHFAATVHDSAQAMLTIINDILDFSKIEAGKMELETAPFSLIEMVIGTVELFNPTAQKKGLKLSCSLASELPEILTGDAGRLRQIVTNLVNNALKFTEQGEILIEVKQKEQLDDSVLVYVEVKDSGIGIPEDAQDLIFERFSQADGSMNRKFGGTGLGLTIVRQLVELMGGSIGVNSRPGKGSTFWFTVRLLKSEEQPTQSIQAKNRAHNNSGSKVSDLLSGQTTAAGPQGVKNPNEAFTILVAEDNPVNQDLIKTTLTMLNYKVDLAFNGKEALDAWAHKGYDIILMDGQMPVMDGFEATRQIRELEAAGSRSRVTIIAMTGQAITGDREIFLAAGMDDYLPKPFSLKQVRDLLNLWLPPGNC